MYFFADLKTKLSTNIWFFLFFWLVARVDIQPNATIHLFHALIRGGSQGSASPSTGRAKRRESFWFHGGPISCDVPSNEITQFRAMFTARHGEIHEAKVSGFDDNLLQGEQIHRINDWRQLLMRENDAATHQMVGSWFNDLFGNGTGTQQ